MNIFVGNLPTDVTEDELLEEFLSFGQVQSIILMNDKHIDSAMVGGHGFVEMASKSEGEAAVASLKDKIIRGRMIKVIEALPLSAIKNHGNCNKKGSPFSSRR
ncbi:RNA recognition motif domain-containing protein [Chloroflexota bacterium]